MPLLALAEYEPLEDAPVALIGSPVFAYLLQQLRMDPDAEPPETIRCHALLVAAQPLGVACNFAVWFCISHIVTVIGLLAA
jgi:hypothetical protein